MITNNEAIDFLETKYLSKLIDNTLLKQDATETEIGNFIEESSKYNFASVCINPCWVALAKNILKKKTKVTTVIGFPLGANKTEIKEKETEAAIKDGADEIDMVINIGLLKSKNYKYVGNEIKIIKDICGKLMLKTIIETCLLSKDEIVIISKIAMDNGADFVKTSTGFSKEGADEKDILLIRQNIRDHIGIKASGGIRDFEKLKKMILNGATRVGTSNGIAIINSDKGTIRKAK